LRLLFSMINKIKRLINLSTLYNLAELNQRIVKIQITGTDGTEGIYLAVLLWTDLLSTTGVLSNILPLELSS
jgi:hypothetical protein